jgi:hypothetical protein
LFQNSELDAYNRTQPVIPAPAVIVSRLRLVGANLSHSWAMIVSFD